MKKVIVTGSAGFIGFHVSLKLLKKKYLVLGIDNLNSYYDLNLKKSRLNILKKYKNFNFEKINISRYDSLKKAFLKFQPSYVIHLAAQAGVRYSLTNPRVYLDSNLIGFFNILELSKSLKIKHLIYASTSSVYGANKKMPFSERDMADHPIQFYAATKRSNEIMAHSYSSIYNLPTTGLRFFTVYGPWGRPDMSLFTFVEKILKNQKIDVFNYGKHKRDFTYIDDIVNGIFKLTFKIPKKNKNCSAFGKDPSSSSAPFEIYNIGNNNPTDLMTYIKYIEKKLKIPAKINFLPLQKGDILNTKASLQKIYSKIKYAPKTSIKTGISKFINWYLKYKNLK